MSATSLAEAFRNGNGRKTKWNGETVYSLFQIDVKAGDIVEIERRRSSVSRAQALKIGTNKGNLRANGILTETAAVWTHTSPTVATLEIVDTKTRSIDVWNSWSSDGVDSSWLGNAGMVVESRGQTHTLRCSDGLGTATFDDLVVTVTVRAGV